MPGSFCGSSIVVASTWTLKRALMNWRAFSPCSGLREVMVTRAPSRASRPAARWPTGPVPARMTTFRPFRSPSVSSIFTTAATAVVFDPLESSMTDTRRGSNMASCAIASSCSPADMLLPPIQTAVLCRSLGPRVKMQPWIEIADVTLGDPAVAHDLVRAGVVGDDLVEHAGQPGTVELEQELAHRRSHLP